jgi:drug/metabolite transporter (DMT)-like permease
LLGLAQLQHKGLASSRVWALSAASGILLFGCCHGALAFAEKFAPSGLASVMLATAPFWIVLLRFIISGADRPKGATLIALVTGMVGVAIFASPSFSQGTGSIDLGTVLILLAAAFCWAAGSIISKRQAAAISATASAGMQLICGGVALLIPGLLTGEFSAFSLSQISPVSWAAFGYLTLAGSVVAFTAYVWLLDHAPASLVATYTFVNPIVAVALGWAVLGEHFTCFALVVASVIAGWRLEAAPA